MQRSTPHAVASVVVPAHDEEAVVGRCLATLLASARPGEFDVVVVCNACTDATAEIAASFPGVRVVEIDEASKPAALDAGDAATDVFPRVYLDADIRLDTQTARALCATLRRPRVEAAAPRPFWDAEGRPWTVRRYVQVAGGLPAFGDGYVGSGVIGLSAAGRSRFDAWPRGLPDDGFVTRLVPRRRRATSPGRFRIAAPATLRAQIRRFVRVQGLNRALERAHGHSLAPATARPTTRHLARMLASPRRWAGVGLFVGVSMVSRVRARLRYRKGDAPWARDDSIRAAVPAPTGFR